MKNLCFCFLAALILFGCTKDNDSPEEAPAVIKIQGKVLDENKKPVSGSQVELGDRTTTTNAEGDFVFEGVSSNTHLYVIKVSKSGYFTGLKTAIADRKSDVVLKFQLLPQDIAGSFQSGTGGTLPIAGGGSVQFYGGTFIRAKDNAAYSGKVTVSAHYIDPSASASVDIMPGDLTGINLKQEGRGMKVYGSMALILTGDAGEKLQLAAGKSALLTIPVPSSLNATAPGVISSWSYDEVLGTWKEEEAKGIRSGANYTLETSHFSFWCCADALGMLDFKGTIKTSDGQPLRYGTVDFMSNFSGYGTYTDSAGEITWPKIPANVILQLRIFDKCTNEIYNKTIGPFTEAVDIGTIVVAKHDNIALVISGKAINCSGGPVNNGVANIDIDGRIYHTAISNGKFSIALDKCDVSSATVTVSAEDKDSKKLSEASAFTITKGSLDAGTINTCKRSTDEYLTLNLDGTEYKVTQKDSLYYSSGLTENAVGSMYTEPAKDQYINMSSYIKGAGVGTFPYRISFIAVKQAGVSHYFAEPQAMQITVTEFGEKQEYITGSFTGSMSKDYGNYVTVSGKFRIRIRF